MVSLCDHNLCRRIYVSEELTKKYNSEKITYLEQLLSLESSQSSSIVSARILVGRPMLYIDLYKYLPSNFVFSGIASQEETIEFYRFVVKYDLIDPKHKKRYYHSIVTLPEIDEMIVDYFYADGNIDEIMGAYWTA